MRGFWRLCVVLIAMACLGGCTPKKASVSQAKQASSEKFGLISHLPIECVAEIVSATPDGNILVYTNSEKGTIDFVDISNPSKPQYWRTNLPIYNTRREVRNCSSSNG